MVASVPAPLDGSFALPLDAPFTLAQATAEGLSRGRLARLVRDGLVRRMTPSVYVAAHVADTVELRVAALTLVVPSGSFVCDRTAAWLHAGERALAPGDHLVVPRICCFRPADAGRLRNGLTDSGERSVRPEDLVRLGGLTVTTPLRTALDLGRLERTESMALHGLDTMLSLGAFSREELLAAVPRFARQRHVVRLRERAPLADGLAASFGESALRVGWYAAGLPRPRCQVPVVSDGGALAFLDLGLEEERFAAEYDGEQWHDDDPDSEDARHDAHRRAWVTEQRGWWLEVFRRDGVFGPTQDADLRLGRAFRDARRTLGERRRLFT